LQIISAKHSISSGKDNATLLIILLIIVAVVYIKKEKNSFRIDLSHFGPMFSTSQFHAIPFNYSVRKVTDVCMKLFSSHFMSNWKASATILLERDEKTLELFKEILI